MVQWQNAIHLPGDIWLNIDMQWMSKGNEGNSLLESSSYLNAKLYKAFCKNRFSVTLEANDIFNKSARDFTFYNKDVTLYQKNLSNNRSFQLTLQYNFNTTRDRYRGRGAGQSEKDRF
ncbi:outer membrane beta-barrel protein [Phocaeicola vulgatus]